MGYSSDLQQDKPPVWRTLDLTIATIKVFVGQIRTLQFETERAEDNCWRSFATATELANHFVRNCGKPFREAYQIVGRLIQHLEANALTLRDADVVLKWLEANGVGLSREEYVSCVDPGAVVERQTSNGGTAPAEVRAMIVDLRGQLRSFDDRLSVIATRAEAALFETCELASAFAQGTLSGAAIAGAVPGKVAAS
jgi:argininosuccinate lyase